MKYFVVFLAVFFVVVQGKPADGKWLDRENFLHLLMIIRLLNVYDIKALKTSSCIYSLDEHGQLANGKDKEDDCTEEDGCERRRDSGDCWMNTTFKCIWN